MLAALTGGHTVTFGVWLLVEPEDLQGASRVWETAEYADLVLDALEVHGI